MRRSRGTSGENLRSVETSITQLEAQPGVAKLLQRPALKTAYDNLSAVMRDATSHYCGGGSVKELERTAGESLNTTAYIALDAVISDLDGTPCGAVLSPPKSISASNRWRR
jgi:hypothetical protein